MTNYTNGTDALNALTETGGGDNSFTKFNVGSSYRVRALGLSDLFTYIGYGNQKKGVSTFAAKNPSKRDAKGYAVDKLTPWDLAEKHYRLQQFAELDAGNADKAKEFGTLANLYKGSPRFVLGFANIETGDLIAVDLSKAQAQAIHAVIKKYEKKIDKLAFDLTKTNPGSRPQDTKVELAPIIDFEDDLTDKEKAAFRSFDGKEFDKARFDGILYEMEDAEQYESLTQAGFDVKLIGYSKEDAVVALGESTSESASQIADVLTKLSAGGPIEMSDDDLPF